MGLYAPTGVRDGYVVMRVTWIVVVGKIWAQIQIQNTDPWEPSEAQNAISGPQGG